MPASIDRQLGGRKRLGMEGTVCQIVRQRRIGRIHDGRTTTATAEKATTHTAIESVVAASLVQRLTTMSVTGTAQLRTEY